MAFWEVEFPRTIGYKSAGGPSFSTVVNKGFSGQEQRNRNWAFARSEYTVSLETPGAFANNRQAFIELLLAFFYKVGGQADGFRLYDWADHTAKNQAVASIKGNSQLVKKYVIGGRTYQRVITKPITADVTDYQGNALANTVFLAGSNTPVPVDAATGIPSAAPGTALDFEFDVPVRFDTDLAQLVAEPSAWGSGSGIASLQSMKLIEVLAPNY